jgi:hypothetical protein
LGRWPAKILILRGRATTIADTIETLRPAIVAL